MPADEGPARRRAAALTVQPVAVQHAARALAAAGPRRGRGRAARRRAAQCQRRPGRADPRAACAPAGGVPGVRRLEAGHGDGLRGRARRRLGAGLRADAAVGGRQPRAQQPGQVRAAEASALLPVCAPGSPCSLLHVRRYIIPFLPCPIKEVLAGCPSWPRRAAPGPAAAAPGRTPRRRRPSGRGRGARARAPRPTPGPAPGGRRRGAGPWRRLAGGRAGAGGLRAAAAEHAARGGRPGAVAGCTAPALAIPSCLAGVSCCVWLHRGTEQRPGYKGVAQNACRVCAFCSKPTAGILVTCPGPMPCNCAALLLSSARSARLSP